MKLSIIIMSLFFAGSSIHPDITGKTYQAEVQATCKTMKDGGCMIYTYCVLSFEKDQVAISTYVKASCTAKEKEAGYESRNGKDFRQYKWHTKNNIVYIEGFEDYGAFTYKEETLVASKDVNGKREPLIFSATTPAAKK